MNIVSSVNKVFEGIKQLDKNNLEFWSARDLFGLLGYSTWQVFEDVIKRAKKACFKSGEEIENHFKDLTKMVLVGSNTNRKIQDYQLDRYACYLIAQNGDSKITQIALAQTYFAIQTRRQELVESEEFEKLNKRIFIRNEVKKENKKLFGTAKNSGVTNFGEFNDAGYRGLYGSPISEIEKKKNLKKGELLDRAGGAELAANLFRITQTEDKLQKDKIKTQYDANTIHSIIGSKVRQTIKDIGGTLPENMKLEKSLKGAKKLKQLQNKI